MFSVAGTGVTVCSIRRPLAQVLTGEVLPEGLEFEAQGASIRLSCRHIVEHGFTVIVLIAL